MQPANAQCLEPGFLYAVLLYRDDLTSWHWSFFVPDWRVLPIGTRGTIFHIENGTTERKWHLKIEQKDIISSPLVVAVIRLTNVAVLGGYDDIVSDTGLLPMFREVAVPSSAFDFESSRQWFLDAICVLNDCGVVSCDDIWPLEREIKRYAFMAMDQYLQSNGWTAYVSEHCS